MHEDLALENAAGDPDTRLTVLLQRADRVSVFGRTHGILADLL